MSDTVLASNGANLPLDSLAQVFAYDGTNLSTITVQYGVTIYVQTFTYSDDNLIEISGWVAQ